MRMYTSVLPSFTQVHRRVPILKEDFRKNLKVFILFVLTLYLDQDLASETVGISYSNLYDLNVFNVVTSWFFCFIFAKYCMHDTHSPWYLLPRFQIRKFFFIKQIEYLSEIRIVLAPFLLIIRIHGKKKTSVYLNHFCAKYSLHLLSEY